MRRSGPLFPVERAASVTVIPNKVSSSKGASMAWPAALNVKTLHGKIVAPTVLQTPAVGTVTFHLPFPLRDSPDNVIVGPQKIPVTLVAGEFTIELPCTDDPDISPVGWSYKVVVSTDIWKASFDIQIPIAAVSPLELADLAPAVTPPALIVYALQGHLHAQYIPYSLLTAKGALIVATGPGAAIEWPVGVNGRVLTADSSQPGGIAWLPGGSGGGGGFMGVWNPGSTYNPGESVLYRDGYYSTVAGSAPGNAPVTVTDAFAAVPTTLDPSDFGDYLFRGLFIALARVRLVGMTWYKAASQINVPHQMRLYNVTRSTTTPIATAFTVGAAAGAVGQFRAPIIADVPQAGDTFAAVVQAGAGAESGYYYTPGFTYPHNVGSVRMTAGGFASGFGNITSITNPGTNYSNVAPQWEEPHPDWVLTGRFDPAVIGDAAVYNYPVIPV